MKSLLKIVIVIFLGLIYGCSSSQNSNNHSNQETDLVVLTNSETPSPSLTPEPSLTPTITLAPTETQTPTPSFSVYLEEDLLNFDGYAKITLDDIKSGRLAKYIRTQITTNPLPNGKTCEYDDEYLLHNKITESMVCQGSQEYYQLMVDHPEMRSARVLYGFTMERNDTKYYILVQAYANADGTYRLVFFGEPDNSFDKRFVKQLQSNNFYLAPFFYMDIERMKTEYGRPWIEKFIIDMKYNDEKVIEYFRKWIKTQNIPEEIERMVFCGWTPAWNPYNLK